MSLSFQRAIVVGASVGIGAEIARQLAASGCSVALLARREPELQRLAASLAPGGSRALPVVHDVTDHDAIPGLFERLVGELGGLDLLVYAAGDLHAPEEGEYDFARDRRLMEVNLLGAMAWTTVAAAHFESRRAGTIVGLSSIAGVRGRRSMPGYTTSKAALSAWLEALRNRVSRHGVNVVTVKPGFVDTDMTRHMTRKPMMISAPEAARQILAVARKGGSPSAYIPFRWTLVAMVIRHLPSWLFRRLDL